jgi:hypothetical protein
MSDETIESLKQAFMKESDNIQDDCPMADQVSDYAFGELGPEDSKEVEYHLKSCRACLDLFMDIKMAEEDAKNRQGEKVEVLPGLQKAIKKNQQPAVSPFQKIGDAFSDFFDVGFSLRPVAAFATIVLIVFVGFYAMQGTSNAPYGIEIMLHGRTQIDLRGGQPEYNDFKVEPGGKLNSGDYFRFQVKIDDDAYVYVVFQDSLGNLISVDKGFIDGGSELFLPDSYQWYQLDDKTGVEKLYLIASTGKIDDFGDKVEKLKTDGIASIDKIFPDTTIKDFGFRHQ